MLKQFELLDIEIEALKKDQSIYGVLLSGSLAYEKATEYSDIDLIVLSNKNEFLSRRVEGILIEEHFHIYEKLVDGLDKNPAEVYNTSIQRYSLTMADWRTLSRKLNSSTTTTKRQWKKKRRYITGSQQSKINLKVPFIIMIV